MGAVAHPAANRNALEFFRAVFEGKVLGIDLQMMVAMLLENRMFNVVQYVLAIDRHPNTCTASLCDFCPVAQGIDCYSNPVSARASNSSITPPVASANRHSYAGVLFGMDALGNALFHEQFFSDVLQPVFLD